MPSPTPTDPWSDPHGALVTLASAVGAAWAGWSYWQSKFGKPERDPNVVRVSQEVLDLRAHVDAVAAGVRSDLEAETRRLNEKMETYHLQRRNDTEALRLEVKGDIVDLRAEVNQNHKEVMGALMEMNRRT